MTIDKFLNGYKLSKNKQEYLKTCVKNVYMPYEQKIEFCSSIIQMSRYNSPTEFVLFTMKFINSYTTLDVNFNCLFEEFDKLERNNLIDVWFKDNELINMKEFIMLRNILDMLKRDIKYGGVYNEQCEVEK